MKRLILLFGVATVCLVSAQISLVAEAETQPLVGVYGRTIVAFFPPVTDAELQKDADTNEALADFRLYATRVREPLKKGGQWATTVPTATSITAVSVAYIKNRLSDAKESLFAAEGEIGRLIQEARIE